VKYILDIADNANVKIQVKEAHWHVLKEPNSLSLDMKLETSRVKTPWSNPGDSHIPEGSPSDRSRAIYDEAVPPTREAARIRSPSRSL
jgi:hypothetical protein